MTEKQQGEWLLWITELKEARKHRAELIKVIKFQTEIISRFNRFLKASNRSEIILITEAAMQGKINIGERDLLINIFDKELESLRGFNHNIIELNKLSIEILDIEEKLFRCYKIRVEV